MLTRLILVSARGKFICSWFQLRFSPANEIFSLLVSLIELASKFRNWFRGKQSGKYLSESLSSRHKQSSEKCFRRAMWWRRLEGEKSSTRKSFFSALNVEKDCEQDFYWFLRQAWGVRAWNTRAFCLPNCHGNISRVNWVTTRQFQFSNQFASGICQPTKLRRQQFKWWPSESPNCIYGLRLAARLNSEFTSSNRHDIWH